MRCSLSHIPYCVLERTNRSERLKKGLSPHPLQQSIIYYDPQIITGDVVKMSNIFDLICGHCSHKTKCPGFKPYDLGETLSEGSASGKPGMS